MNSARRVSAATRLPAATRSALIRAWRLPLLVLLAVLSLLATAQAQQSTFQINSATMGNPPVSFVYAGMPGVTLNLTGTLPTSGQVSSYLACFYTGFGSTTGFSIPAPNNDGSISLPVPAAAITGIPQASFTAANGYSITALLYFVHSDGYCDGQVSEAQSNQLAVQVVAPSLVSNTGPTNVPKTNSATGIQAAPTAVTLTASGYITGTGSGGTTTVTFGTFGSSSVTASTTAISAPVPTAFSSSPVGTTASLSICNTFGGNSVCTTPTPAITLTVTALATSTATITATPTPVSAAGQTVLSAQFTGTSAAGAGAPSGNVTFVAGGTTLPAAKLILDNTATFNSQTTSVTANTATPVITPPGGTYTSVQTVTITDATPGAVIYYTQDGSTPTASSTVYSAPFSIANSETVRAIAVAAGSGTSSIATAVYAINLPPPTQLVFKVQPTNTVLNTAIAPPVQVALEDATGTVVANSNAAVSIALANNPTYATLGGTLTVNAVNGIATFPDLTLNLLGSMYTLIAYTDTLTTVPDSNPFNITPPGITITLPSALVGESSTLTGVLTLGAPAGTGGLVVSLSSSNTAYVTVGSATVTIPAGQTTGSFTYTGGTTAGTSTLTATATGYTSGTATVTSTAAQVSLGMIPTVAPAQSTSIALSLATPAPTGGTTVTFTIANPSIATVTQTSFIPAGSQTPAANPQVTGVLIGTTTVTATAVGYAPAMRTVNVTVTAAFNPSYITTNLTTNSSTLLTISAPAPPGGITFNLTSASPATATVPASVTIAQGAMTAAVPVTGVADGTTTISATSTGIATANATVIVDSQIPNQAVLTGYDLQTDLYYSLPVTPNTPTTVTITSNDPTVAVLSTSSTTAGQASLTFNNLTSTNIGYLYVQGLKVGSTTLTVSAPGYTTGTTTVTVDNTGFSLYDAPNISITDYASPVNTYVLVSPLNSDLTVNGSVYFHPWSINPQSAAVNIPVTSSNTSVGTVTSPVVFNPGDSSDTFTFTPLAVGTTNLTLGTPPAGFTVPSQYQQITATVTTPVISAPTTSTGVHLQIGTPIYLPVAPPTGVTVTVSVPNGTVATLSKSNTVAGTASLTFTNVTSTSVGTIYVQGQSAGTVTLTVAASGYTSGTSTITVQPSGFIIYAPENFSTTTFSSATQQAVFPALLDPTSLAPTSYYYSYYSLSPGVGPVSVPVNDSATSVGTVSPSAVVFNTGDIVQNFNFTPAAAGSATLSLGTPAGFSTPANSTSIVATVTAPQITAASVITGVHLQTSYYITLPVAPPTPVNITVTSSAPLVATLSNSTTVAGTASVTFMNVSSTYVGTIYVQGQSAGSATVTVSASSGYTSGSNTITVDPSGFAYYYASPISTTTFSGPSELTVYPVLIGSNSIQFFCCTFNPGVAPITVPITNSNNTVGTISANSVTFAAADTSESFNFQPVSAGTTNITLGTPAGFSTPPNSITTQATVTAPQIYVGSPNTGVNLETQLNISLPLAPPNPVNVTVTSEGPSIAVLSTSGTVVGTNSVTFMGVNSTTNMTVYVQGLSTGSTTIKVSAPGYIDGTGTITVYPSGFTFGSDADFTTSATAGAYSIPVYPALLNSGTDTIFEDYYQLVSPGAGTVNLSVTSSNTAVGTIVTSPLVFAPGSGAQVYAQFQPVATGTSTITLGTPTGFTTPSQYTTATATVQ